MPPKPNAKLKLAVSIRPPPKPPKPKPKKPKGKPKQKSKPSSPPPPSPPGRKYLPTTQIPSRLIRPDSLLPTSFFNPSLRPAFFNYSAAVAVSSASQPEAVKPKILAPAMQSWAAAMKTSPAVDGDVVGATLSEPPVFPENVPQDESDEVTESESDDSDDEVIYVGTKDAGGDDGGGLSEYDSCPKPLHSSSSSLDEGEVRDVPESNDVPESKVHSEVDLDRLLISIQDSSKPGPLLLAPPAPSVLGKRARSPSPELALSPELFEEIGRVNGMFRVPCINLEAPPATFELCVAGSSEWRVLLAFSSDYPSELPSVIQLDGHKHGAKMFKLTKDILRGDNFQGGTPCLEKLMRELVEALAGKLGTIPWKFIPQTTKFVPKPSSVGGFMTTSAPKVYPKAWFPSFEEFDDQMRALRAASVDYPPKLPVYAKRDGWNTAFISEPYARSLLKEGKVIEGNERLEFLGDSILNALISASMMKMYQINEGGMTRLHDILRSNALFSSFSRAYEFPDKLLREKEAQGPMGFKVEADIFEAAVGGLFEDGAGEERGWIQLQTWFEVLIEPWIDWTIARLDPALRDSYLTFNRVPLDKKSQSPLNPKGLVLPKTTRRDRKILKPTTPLTRSRKGAKFLPSKPPKPPKQPKKKKPKLSKARNLVPYVPPQMAVQQYSAPNMAMVNAEQPHAGSAERRWEHLASIGHHPPQTYQNMQHWGYGQTRNYTMLPDVRLPENQIFLQQQQQQHYQPPTTHGAPGLIYDSYP